MTTKTYRFGNDCMGNTPNAMTVEGKCYGNIYKHESVRYWNSDTKESGTVSVWDDGELHFTATKCAECGVSDATLRDDWELNEGKMLCCECNTDSRSRNGVPQEWQRDYE